MFEATRTPRSFVQGRLDGVVRRIVTCTLAGCAALAGESREARAQSIGDLAAWDALIVSPVGALPPRAHDGLFPDGVQTEFSLRYGRWRYDQDDAIHNDMGFTLARHLGVAHTSVAVTAAYLSLSCGTCSAWLSGGIAAETRLIQDVIPVDSLREVTVNLGVRASAGAARYMGEGHAVATSVAGAASIGLVVPFAWSSRMSLSVLPGVGIGRFTSLDEDAYGTLPMLGASMAWALRSGVVMDLGIQRIFIDGGPNQVGLGLSWVRR